MLFIPGILISIVTFPGVIVHELAHQMMCRLLRVAVLDVRYFRFRNPMGYVVHEIPEQPIKQILIGVGPFLFNTVLGALIALPGAIPILKFESGGLIDYFYIWLGVSIAMHSFPSTGDAQGIWNEVRKKETPLWIKVLATPMVGLIYVGAMGSVVWLDFFYGIGVAKFVPQMIIKLLA